MVRERKQKKYSRAWIRRRRQQRLLGRITLHAFLLVVTLTVCGTGGFYAGLGWASSRAFATTATPTAPVVVKMAPTSALPVVVDPDTLEVNPWDYFRPAWRPQPADSAWLSVTQSQRQPERPLLDYDGLLRDPKHRIEKEFQVPDGMRARVLFWLNVYCRYNTHMRIVHDSNNPEIIYGYIDFRALYHALGTAAWVDGKAYQLERKILKELKARLQEAVGATATTQLASTERAAIRDLLSRHGLLSATSLQEHLGSMRTQSGQSDMFLLALYRSRNLLPHIESVLRRNDLPIGLARIPFVESSFNYRAHSKVGAVGIWQFMPETSRQFIHSVEDRSWSDPIIQTRGAAKLIKIFRSQLPDWSTTVTSYNSGAGRLKHLCDKYHVKTVEGLLNVNDDESLGFAGKNFYAEFLAANLVEAYKEEIFTPVLAPTDFSLVFKNQAPMPKELCDI